MNVKQALKKKNRLVGLINQAYLRASQYNSIETGNERPYSAKASIQEWMTLTDELIALKCKIQLANNPVNDKIYRLSELKAQAKYLRDLNCTSGVQQRASRWSNESVVQKESEISVLERDQMVEKIEEQIEVIQDELDAWNHKTLV